MLIEVCANSTESALNAENGGADRIELCCELGVGGITPSLGLLKSVKERVSIPIHVLIRPRSGDFNYSKSEFDVMIRDIGQCVEMGFDGIVCGILHKNFELDEKRTETLIKASGSLKFTFHRAFDWVIDPIKTLARLEDLGVDYILSSGQQKSAIEGIELLEKLHQKAKKCSIIPGAGIGPGNVSHFMKKGFGVVHLSGTKIHQNSQADPKIPMHSSQFLSDTSVAITDLDIIRKMVSIVK